MVQTGRKVPRLSGVLHDGSTLALQDLRGGAVVVYFYPKDATAGCTREAQDFRDLHPAFRRLGCTILGVSRDSAASHARFREKQALPFALVADTDERWCEAFGVLGEKTLYGRRFIGVIRSTFLVDASGTLAAEWRGVKVPGHAAAVLERVQAL
jgi:peroxiredoxin Q/BCP